MPPQRSTIEPHALLCFPPSWTLSAGSPHLAIPLLAASLRSFGWNTSALDLNWDFLASNDLLLSADVVSRAAATRDASVMDTLIFDIEDRLQAIVSPFGGTWNPHEGYDYQGHACRSSGKALAAAAGESPFTSFFSLDVVPRILSAEPALICISICSVHQLIPTLELCRLLRRQGFSGFICVGGNTVTRLREELRIHALFDLIDGFIVYQGERAVVALARALRDGTGLAAVPQLTWRDGDELRVNTVMAAPDPNQVITPTYDGLATGQYAGTNHLAVMAARGCYYGKCTFCAIPFGWSPTGFAGIRSADRVVQDIIALKSQYNISRFKFVDEALPTRTIGEIARLLIERDAEVQWEGYARLERTWLNPDFLKLLANSGFRKAYFGVEILPSEGRDALNKNDRAHPAAVFRACADAAIRTHCFCMFGFPGTTRADAEATLGFVLSNQDIIDTADVFPWSYAKHTNVAGAKPIIETIDDWALDYEHVGCDRSVLDSEHVRALAAELEEALWQEAPLLLHPVYRLNGPWRDERPSVLSQCGAA